MISLQLDMLERKERPKGPVGHIDEQDRLAIRAQMKAKGIKNAALAKECDVTRSAITLLLSKPIPKGKTRGCKFLDKLQAALGLAVTARRPSAVISEMQRRAENVLKKLADDPEGLSNWLANGELLASRAQGKD